MNRPPDTEPSNATVPPDAEDLKAEPAATWKPPPPLRRKLPPDPLLVLKDRARAAPREAEKMREAARQALRDYFAKGE